MRTSQTKVKFMNMEVSDIICKVQNEMKLPVDEQPKIMKNYMHVNMVKQANQSLNTQNVQ